MGRMATRSSTSAVRDGPPPPIQNRGPIHVGVAFSFGFTCRGYPLDPQGPAAVKVGASKDPQSEI